MMNKIKLTQFSPGAGCGCKIAPKDLEDILKSSISYNSSSNLLVGNACKDDAAVYDIGNNQAVISTTDFFTPIVDDPFDFGRIAATNALSDIYAMGGKPIMGISILGWPLDKLPKETAQKVIEGAREMCNKAGIALAGGHSIDISDPIFGLAVTGMMKKNEIKQNNNAVPGCKLFLTKPLGIGIITTAEKKGIVRKNDLEKAIELMTTLNTIGENISKLPYVKAMTDVTGFGFLGHLLEICEASNIMAKIDFKKVPIIDVIFDYIKKKAIPGGTFRNWKSYGHKIKNAGEAEKLVLCDPQTSGGLLIAVEENYANKFVVHCNQHNLYLEELGWLYPYDRKGKFIEVMNWANA